MLLKKNLSRNTGLILLLIFSSLVIFSYLGRPSYYSVDEAKYSQISREMLQNKDIVTLTVFGKKYFKKPPLGFWIRGLCFYLFGVSEFTVRLPCALFGLGCLVITYLIALQWYDRNVAILSTFILLTCSHFMHRRGLMSGVLDTQMLFFFLLSIYLFLKGRRTKACYYLSFISMGLCSLTKNFMGFMPLAIIILFLAATIKLRIIPLSRWVWGCMIMAGVMLPWYVTMISLYGNTFIKIHIANEVVARALGEFRGRTGYFFFFPVVRDGFFPWVCVAVFTVPWQIVKTIRSRREEDVLLLIWVFVIFLSASFLKNKYFWHILPLYPPLSIIISQFLLRSLERGRPLLFYLFICMVVLCIILLFTPDPFFNPYRRLPVIYGAATVIPVKFAGDLWGKWVYCGIPFFLFPATFLLKKGIEKRPYVKSCFVAILVSFLSIKALYGYFIPLRFSKTVSQTSAICREISRLSPGTQKTLFFYGQRPISFDFVDRCYLKNIPDVTLREGLIKDYCQLLKEMEAEKGRLFLLSQDAYSKIKERPKFKERHYKILFRKNLKKKVVVLLGAS